MTSVILLDAHSSATIEGAHTTVERMKKCLQDPVTKDEIMVANTYKACMYAYNHQIEETNIRELWDIIVNDVCENRDCAGTLYRDGMVYVGDETKTEHRPAEVEDIPKLMENLFSFERSFELDPLIKSFVFHFYFVYIHPFCDGNGRTARTINSSQLYFAGFPKVRSIAIATAISRNLSGYYKSIRDSEIVIDKKKKNGWLDLSPFVDYMQTVFEESMINAGLANIPLYDVQRRILDRMNQVGNNAEITVKKAMKITKLTENATRNALNTCFRERF